MRLALQLCAALATGAMIVALAPDSFGQTSAHGIQPVVDGTTEVGPLHGGAQGSWIAPGLQAGSIAAKLYDSQGVERYTLDGEVTQYLFFVAAPAQGEIHGRLLVPHVAVGRIDIFALTEIFALVEGQWIETSTGRGAFSASILQVSADQDQPLLQIGQIQGTFQLSGAIQAGRIQVSQAALTHPGPDSGSGAATNSVGHVQLTPPLEILNGPVLSPGHGIQFVGSDVERRAMNDHGGLGQVGLGQGGSGSSSAAGNSTVVNESRGRLALRWQLFE